MEFDRLCKEVERRFPQHRQMLEEARLFLVDVGDSPTINRGGKALQNWAVDEQIAENFHIPFPCVAIEHHKSCVVLKAISVAERTYHLIGSHTAGDNTIFYEATIVALPNAFTTESTRLGKIVRCKELEIYRNGKSVDFMMSELALIDADRPNFHTPTTSIELIKNGPGYFKIGGDEIDIWDSDVKATVTKLDKHIGTIKWGIDGLTANMAFMEINTAILCMLIICEPSRFIVEESLANRKPYTGKLIQRSPTRPKYIALAPGEIKKRYLYDERDPTDIPRSPHERRGHYRRLTSDRYVSKKGHLIWIKDCWVGKTEGIKGKNRYVVQLNLREPKGVLT